MKTPLALVVLSLSFAACAPDQSPSERREAALARAESPAETTRVDPADVPPPPEPAAARLDTQAPVSNPDQERLQRVLEAMATAQAEAAEAEGRSTCEQAFDSTVRFAASLREAFGGSAVGEADQKRDAFIRGCEALPDNVQQCMVMSYSISHQEECAAIRRDMSEETRGAVRELTQMIGTARREE